MLTVRPITSCLLLLGLTASPYVYAGSCNQLSQDLMPTFSSTHKTKYYPLMCSDNILALINNLKLAGQSLESAQVLHITHKSAPYKSIQPLIQKLRFKGVAYKPSPWVFHAVLIIDGLVLDMDYTDRLQTTGFNNYMKTMWRQGTLSDYRFQLKPAELYTNIDLGGTFGEAQHPSLDITSLNEHLSELECSDTRVE